MAAGKIVTRGKHYTVNSNSSAHDFFMQHFKQGHKHGELSAMYSMSACVD